MKEEIMLNKDWKVLFSKTILGRGKKYALEGAVEKLMKEGDRLRAIVMGTGNYLVEMSLRNGMPVAMDCTCPYASDGKNCKHMAAVLFALENEEKGESLPSTLPEGGGILPSPGNSSPVIPPVVSLPGKKGVPAPQMPAKKTVDEIIDGLSKEELASLMKKMVRLDDNLADLVYIRKAPSLSKEEIREWKREINSIFNRHKRGGMIEYYDAFDFQSEICDFLDTKVTGLLDAGHFEEAFELSRYIFVKLGKTTIDDDGEVATISNACMDIWRRIIRECPKDVYRKIDIWVRKHASDGTVVDYMEEYLQNFMQNELATEEDLRNQLKILDKVIEKAGKETKSPYVRTPVINASDGVEKRLEIMKRLGSSKEEIEDWRRAHRHFRVIREAYMKEAEERGDTAAIISLLEEGKSLDKDNRYLIFNDSRKLADAYHKAGNREKELVERVNYFLEWPEKNVNDFKTIRSLCPKEEWTKLRQKLLSAAGKNLALQLMEEEGMTDDLYKALLGEPDLADLNRYGYLLEKDHGEELLSLYEKILNQLAEDSRSPPAYDELLRQLNRLEKYSGGSILASHLAKEWMKKWPTRKVLSGELEDYLRKNETLQS